jgi:hypothetical protein
MTQTPRWPGAGASILVALVLVAGLATPASAQFGQNKVQYDKFDFKVLKTERFDIYYYSSEADAAQQVARMAERWHGRLSRALGHTLSSRQAVVLYASHPEFEQTNVIEGLINEAVGGVTEGGRRRVVLPLGATLADTDHVLGHELVHAFQYDILGPMNAGRIPLWFIEGMAEYLSIGARHPQTAMWLRDAVLEDRLPKIDDLSDPAFFPYRFGHAFWAYVAGRWGDSMVGTILISLGSADGGPAGADPLDAIEIGTGTPIDELSTEWHEAIRTQYGLKARGEATAAPAGVTVIGRRTGGGDLNVGASLSPDGTRVAFLSERNLLSIDLYVADAKTGRVIKSLTENSVDPHFESLQFLASAGSWDPAGRRLAVASVRSGRPVIAVFDVDRGDIAQEIKFDQRGEIFQPSWSRDGNSLAFSAQVNGYTDLYLYDFTSAQIRRVTNDAFADLQPAWAPDGQRLVFVTDRFSADLNTLDFKGYGLAFVEPGSGRITPVATGLTGNAVNPQWAGDGASLFFLSDASGRTEAYRLDLASGRAARFASTITGITGITPLSPALSVASSGRVAMTVFRDGGYEVQILDAAQAPTVAAVETSSADLAVLPPAKRTASVITQELDQPTLGLPAAETFPSTEYSPGLSLIGVGQEVGVSSGSQYGTYVSGGVAMMFSDILGNHMVSTSADFNGALRDFSVQTAYLNRSSRWNWGLFGERVPLLSGTVRAGFGNDNGTLVFIEQTERFRQTYQQFGGLVAYPFSRATRVEFGVSGRHIGFHREIHELIFNANTGELLSNERFELPAEPSIRLGDVSSAVVRDTTAFGATGPILGQRFRVDVTPTFGDLRMTTLTTDLRQYVMPVRPLTLVGRLLHAGRYGAGGEDPRLSSLFLGYSTLVRGYDVNSFTVEECTLTPTGACPEFDRLLGSRILVVNLEARGPMKGLFTGNLDYGPIPVELFTFFDAGMAWTRAEQPSFTGGTRNWVTSAGFGARVNIFGFAIGELNLARPLNRRDVGWQFVFNLRPGF